MTGPEHYREAEALLAQATDRNLPAEVVRAYSAVARVHAELATAAAVALVMASRNLAPAAVQQWADVLIGHDPVR